MSKIDNNVEMNNSKIKKRDNKGFTLVELLATLAVLSIIFTIVIYFALNIIGNSKGKSYKVTINNIEKNAGNYVTENNDMLSWRDSSVTGYEYQCITVEHLIEKGYFDSDVLESKVNEDEKVRKENYIYLERDKKTKTINKKILLYDGLGLSGLCTNMDTNGNISFEVKPIGKVVNGYSIGKDITIYYKLNNVSDSVNDYTYEYDYNTISSVKENGKFETVNLQKKIEVDKNGTLNTSIKDVENKDIASNSLNISTIDSVGPIIKLKENNSENQIVRKTVSIPIVVTDGESGVDANSFTKDEIKVTIGGVEVTDIKLEKKNGSDNEVNYNLTINDLLHKGEVVITIVKDKVYDNLDNVNIETVLKPNISFTNEYTITYYLGNGTGTNAAIVGTSSCTYNQNCTLKKFSVTGKTFPLSSNGWIFTGWSNTEKDVSVDYDDNATFKYTKDEDINLYAIGERTFRFYSGTNGTEISNSASTQYWNPYSSETAQYTSINVPTAKAITGWTVVGFRGNNVASSTYAVASGKTGYKPKPNELTSFDFRAIYNRTLTIKYDANGGSGTTGNTTSIQYFNSGVSGSGANVSTPTFTLAENKFSRIGHTFSKWCETSTGGGICTDVNGVYSNWIPAVDDTTVTKILYAKWTVNTYTVKYDANGGTSAPNNQTKTYGVDLTLSSTKPTRDGYTFAGWNNKKDGSGTAYSSGGTYEGNAALTLYAQWSINTYVVSYNANGGTGAPNNQTKTYGVDLTLSSTKPTREGYTFAGWNNKKDGSGTAYSSGGTYKGNAALTLYAQWSVSTYAVKYDANGGTGAPNQQVKKNGVDLTLSSTKPTREGYTFTGWNTKGDGSGTAYSSGGTYKGNVALTLYAQWRINKVYIKYSVNGGTVKSSTTSSSGTKYTWTTDSSGIIYKNGAAETYSINYGGKLSSDGLANWSNSSYIKVTKQEYTAVSDAEWKCLSGCTTSGKTFDHTVVYNASDFCDASKGDCTVVVGVNWTPARVCYKVTADGGLNCRNKPSTSGTSVVTGLSEGGYYMLKYYETSGGYKWYYNSSSGCYAAGHNGTKAWLEYHDTSCPSTTTTPSTPSTPSTGSSCTISGLCVCQDTSNPEKTYSLDCKTYGIPNAASCATSCKGIAVTSSCKCS